MNPTSSSPYPNPFFPSFPPQNPNRNFFFQPPPPLPPQIPPSSTVAPIHDLSTALSSLTDLLCLSNQTLNSLSSLLSPSPNIEDANLIPCAYNPHHLMRPASLFLHSLSCPSPFFENPGSLFLSLHYPNTINLKTPNVSEVPFIQGSSNSDLCLSLDGYYNEFSSNFFYKDCPGVVNFNDFDSLNKTFTLPGVLSVECANFVGASKGDVKGFDRNGFRILPSDLWAIRREIEGWIDYPSIYSYGIFCVVLQLNVIKGDDLRRWIIAHSPRYGVLIDMYMRDHIYVLFRLCFKAIRREAIDFLDDGMNLSFNCPVLCQVLMWIASQLSVLYGETNARSFAIHVFRQCVSEVANRLLFPLESNLKERLFLDSDGKNIRDLKFEEPLEVIEYKAGTEVDKNVDGEVILVSNVAAAVAALHERSLLEAKIKRLQVSQPLTRYHHITEHDYISKRADEERKKRSNYRAIIEHDGLPLKQSINQETSKTRTREELLAEERDYKRRRMSYRGKKVKRTTLQVMRDIIDEYMEEIKQAGGIGCFEKGAAEEGMHPKPTLISDITVDVDGLRKRNSKSSEAIRDASNYYQKQSHPDHNSRTRTSKDASAQEYERQGHGHHRHHEHVEYQRSASRERHGRDYHSRSLERHRIYDLSHERSSSKREGDDVELTHAKHYEMRSSRKSSYQNYKSSDSLIDYANNSSVQKDDEKLDTRDRHRRNSYGKHSSKFLAENTFEDRYDPADSHDTHQDDVYAGKEYVRPEEVLE